MSTSLPDIQRQSSKSFWLRKEGQLGAGILALFAIPALILLNDKVLPFIISLLQNTLHATLLGIVTFCVVYALYDGRLPRLLFWVYRSFCRNLARLYTQVDPIGILETIVERMRERQSDMYDHISRLKGHFRTLSEEMEENRLEAQKAAGAFKQAKDAGKKGAMLVNARMIDRLKEANIDYEKLHRQMDMLIRMLKKYHEMSGYMIQDAAHEVKVKKKRRNAILAAHSAMTAAKGILSGRPDELEMFDMANEYLAEEYGEKLGDIEMFVDTSEHLVESFDLQNAASIEAAMHLVEEWEGKADSFLLLGPGEKENIIAQAKNPSDVLDAEYVEVEVGRSERDSQNKYAHLFDD